MAGASSRPAKNVMKPANAPASRRETVAIKADGASIVMLFSAATPRPPCNAEYQIITGIYRMAAIRPTRRAGIAALPALTQTHGERTRLQWTCRGYGRAGPAAAGATAALRA